MNSLTSLKVNRAAFTKGVYATWFEPCNPRESPYNGALVSSTYFSRNPTLDAQVRASYGALLDLVLKPTHKTTTTSDATQLPTELRHEPLEPFPFEPATPNEALSLIIFFDQFPRNLYRDTSFFCAGDPYAVKYAALVDKNDWDRKELFAPLERLFLALPYEHSECLEHQHRGMAKLRKVVEDAPEQVQPPSPFIRPPIGLTDACLDRTRPSW